MPTNGSRPPDVDLSVFAVDPDGKWKHLAPPRDNLEFRFRPMQLREVQNWIMLETDRRERLNRNQALSRIEQSEIFRSAIAEKVIIDWKGLKQAFSRELAREIMLDDRYCELANAIVAAVLDQSRDESEEAAELGKASEPSSITT